MCDSDFHLWVSKVPLGGNRTLENTFLSDWLPAQRKLTVQTEQSFLVVLGNVLISFLVPFFLSAKPYWENICLMLRSTKTMRPRSCRSSWRATRIRPMWQCWLTAWRPGPFRLTLPHRKPSCWRSWSTSSAAVRQWYGEGPHIYRNSFCLPFRLTDPLG